MFDQENPSRKSPVLRPRVILLTAGAIGGLGALYVYFFLGMPGVADPNDVVQVAQGRAVYDANCASCHGANLEGQPDWRIRKSDGKLPAPPHDETGHTWHHADKQLFQVVKKGVAPPLAPVGYKSDMPSFDGILSDREIWAVIAFVKNSWSEKFRDRQQQKNDAASR